jgi:hypothetical protein
VAYRRSSAAELLLDGQQYGGGVVGASQNLAHWVALKADSVLRTIDDDENAGLILMNMGLRVKHDSPPQPSVATPSATLLVAEGGADTGRSVGLGSTARVQGGGGGRGRGPRGRSYVPLGPLGAETKTNIPKPPEWAVEDEEKRFYEVGH